MLKWLKDLMAQLQQVRKQNNIIILNVIEESRWGGPQTRIFRVAKALLNTKFQPITLFPENNSKKITQIFQDNRLKYFRLKLTPLKSQFRLALKYLLFFIPEVIILKNIFYQFQPQIIQCNGAAQIKGLIAARLLNIPSIWFLNDTRTPKIVSLIFQILVRICNPYIIVNSIRVKKYYLDNSSLKNRSIKVIQSPVDSMFFNKQRENQFDKKKNLKVVTVANVNPDKGLEYFIEMAAKINKQINNIHFYIAGSQLSTQEIYFNKLKALIENLNINNITFMGHVEDIKSFLASSDVYVCSSITEASPISVWEAMATGLPVVSSDVGDVGIFLKNTDYDFITPTKNGERLAYKTLKLLKNSELRIKYGNFLRKVAINKFGINSCINKHIDYYSKIIKENYKYENTRN
jgi:glycosyltransferase involved in cell wall biosynthesis